MAKNKILLKSYLSIMEELVATAAAITPGMLLERTTTAVKAHATGGGPAEKLFALEDGMQGKGIADNYAVSSRIFCWNPTPGDRVNAIFDATSGGAAAIGNFLESAGDGSLRVYTPQASGGGGELTNSIVAVCLEAATPGDRMKVQIV